MRIRALAHAWHGGRMVSGENRKTLGNVFANALRALQPAVGMRACHRIFCCTSSCLRALSVCEPLLCEGVVLALAASPAPGVWAAPVIMSLPGGKSWRSSGAVSAASSEGVWMNAVTSLSGKSSRASGSERRCPTDERLLGASVGATLSGVEPCRISLLLACPLEKAQPSIRRPISRIFQP